ncbi:NAD(P)H-dependent oxidoreductase [Gallaecimonas sp. GXIMD4217]|uniref:flavodoxin family protein n=1 Tax=Gallaecimonas sp. GXIMD4217 TaxID=3131927 RepID=UPI00311AD4F9
MKNGVILLGSARGNGYTAQLAQATGLPVLDLADFDISPFDYRHLNRGDDFLPLVRQLLGYRRIHFASPVYWYCMSAQMKIFFDRLSDLLKIEKALGRQLRGKQAGVLATGGGPAPACFEEVFRRSFGYLGMHYEGMIYLDTSQGLDGRALQAAVRDYQALLSPTE